MHEYEALDGSPHYTINPLAPYRNTTEKFSLQQGQFEALRSQCQLARREVCGSYLPSLNDLYQRASLDLSNEEAAYNSANTQHKEQHSFFKRIFSSASKSDYADNVEPWQAACKRRCDLVKSVRELLTTTTAESAQTEVRDRWNGGVAGVYNGTTGKVEWRDSWHHAVAGVWNPQTGQVEWRENWHGGCHGVWNPKLQAIEWRDKWHHGVYGVWNPKLQIVEWQDKWKHGVCGVWDPLKEAVVWADEWNGAVVGWWDETTGAVVWQRRWHHGLSAVVWEPAAKTYACVTSCGWWGQK